MFTDERRSAKRKSVVFYAEYSLDGETFVPATASEFSLAGLSMLTRERLDEGSLFVRLALDGGGLTCEARRIWDRETEIEGERWFRSGLQFVRAFGLGE